MKLKVSEVFFSIQGEGPLVGMPSVFFRLYGCNLSCSWCDTPYAREPYPFFEMEVVELIHYWRDNFPRIPYVVLTGGEPLMQEGAIPFLEALVAHGAKPLLETNGSLPIKDVPKEVLIVMDLKPPSSGMEEFNLYDNLHYLTLKDAVKIVLKDREDFDWAVDIITKWHLLDKTQVFFSPAHPFLSASELAGLILETRLPIRLQVQLHKILGLK
ncbi:MAG: radical SAM protein [Caldimicrobium sp.]|nr:radical SAM protein [Caldimicrobium sp.]